MDRGLACGSKIASPSSRGRATGHEHFDFMNFSLQLPVGPNASCCARYSMDRLSIVLILAMQCFFATGCDSEEPAPRNSLRLEVQRDSVVDFHRFLEAIKLLVSPQGSSVELSIGPNDKKLSFISVSGFPAEPMSIHVSPDQVAIGSGAGRQPLTVEGLQANLELLAQGALKSRSKAAVLLISDSQVSGEFGLMILNTIADSGIPIVMLAKPDFPEAPVPIPSKKPSSPSER